jgi:hypothetical protein
MLEEGAISHPDRILLVDANSLGRPAEAVFCLVRSNLLSNSALSDVIGCSKKLGAVSI